MQCPFCETELSDTAIVCKGCGAEKAKKGIGCAYLIFLLFIPFFSFYFTYSITGIEVFGVIAFILGFVLAAIIEKKIKKRCTEYTWHRKTILKS